MHKLISCWVLGVVGTAPARVLCGKFKFWATPSPTMPMMSTAAIHVAADAIVHLCRTKNGESDESCCNEYNKPDYREYRDEKYHVERESVQMLFVQSDTSRELKYTLSYTRCLLDILVYICFAKRNSENAVL